MNPVDRFALLGCPVVEAIMRMANLFVSNLWITQRFVALPVDNPVSNLWITHVPCNRINNIACG